MITCRNSSKDENNLESLNWFIFLLSHLRSRVSIFLNDREHHFVDTTWFPLSVSFHSLFTFSRMGEDTKEKLFVFIHVSFSNAALQQHSCLCGESLPPAIYHDHMNICILHF